MDTAEGQFSDSGLFFRSLHSHSGFREHLEGRENPLNTLLRISLLILVFLVSGCTGWKMDYGNSSAHILAEDLRTKGKPYIGGKIAIRGKVESVDTTDPQSCWVILEGNIRCHYGDFQSAANEVKAGETITVSGILTVVENGKVVLDPALGRDPKAPFNPLK